MAEGACCEVRKPGTFMAPTTAPPRAHRGCSRRTRRAGPSARAGPLPLLARGGRGRIRAPASHRTGGTSDRADPRRRRLTLSSTTSSSSHRGTSRRSTRCTGARPRTCGTQPVGQGTRPRGGAKRLSTPPIARYDRTARASLSAPESGGRSQRYDPGLRQRRLAEPQVATYLHRRAGAVRGAVSEVGAPGVQRLVVLGRDRGQHAAAPP